MINKVFFNLTFAMIFSLMASHVNNTNLHEELIKKTKDQNWQIVVGGNTIYQIDIKTRRKIPIMSMADQNNYVWGAAGLSSDGEWLALERSTRLLHDKTDLALINWREFIKQSKPFDKLIQLPLPNFEITNFSWSPNGHSLVIIAREVNEEQVVSKNDYKVYELILETKQLRELPIHTINSLNPKAWSPDGKLVYISEDNTIAMLDAGTLATNTAYSKLAIFDFNTNEITNLFAGNFASWNHKGLLTYLDTTNDTYYTYNLNTRERKILLKNVVERGEEGSVFSPIIWSPDDQYILYGKQTKFHQSSDDLYAMEVATGREILICKGVFPLFAGFASWVQMAQQQEIDGLQDRTNKGDSSG